MAQREFPNVDEGFAQMGVYYQQLLTLESRLAALQYTILCILKLCNWGNMFDYIPIYCKYDMAMNKKLNVTDNIVFPSRLAR